MNKEKWNELFCENGEGFNPYDYDETGREPLWSKVSSRRDKLVRLLNGMNDSDPRRESYEAEHAELVKLYEEIKPF
ncbi:hypothetical protein B4O97_03650 [Marispirochaeta aestuarii]|uniref:Uncharacterized protein n=1 Tax=Marispirochaeta aestuarii TaxID=1963862 RepID=A0A1Y1S2J7_9SPIO|nr:hypothetical protein [Marispirochaeta aestuarii]ORC37296.1 hypothetical protein B4O97_03650 [Marispirochaeta aestuarii]